MYIYIHVHIYIVYTRTAPLERAGNYYRMCSLAIECALYILYTHAQHLLKGPSFDSTSVDALDHISHLQYLHDVT